MLQSCLNFLPEHSEFINEHCAKVCENGRVAIHNASGVMLSYLQSDDYGRRMAIGLLAVERLANAAQLSDAFGVSHSTVYRYQRCYREDGVSGLSHQRSARGGYKLKGDKLLEAQRLLDQGESARARRGQWLFLLNECHWLSTPAGIVKSKFFAYPVTDCRTVS